LIPDISRREVHRVCEASNLVSFTNLHSAIEPGVEQFLKTSLPPTTLPRLTQCLPRGVWTPRAAPLISPRSGSEAAQRLLAGTSKAFNYSNLNIYFMSAIFKELTWRRLLAENASIPVRGLAPSIIITTNIIIIIRLPHKAAPGEAAMKQFGRGSKVVSEPLSSLGAPCGITLNYWLLCLDLKSWYCIGDRP